MVNKLADHNECPIDKYIYRFIDTHLNLYYELGFTPNMITTIAILFGLLASYEIFEERFFTAMLFFFISYYFDCVDGKLARRYNMVTLFGDLYDHFGDGLKYVAIFTALLYNNEQKKTSKQWTYLIILFFLSILTMLHFGYQERISNVDNTPNYLYLYKRLVDFDEHPQKTIRYTKYFGSGTWILCVGLIIFFWCK